MLFIRKSICGKYSVEQLFIGNNGLVGNPGAATCKGDEADEQAPVLEADIGEPDGGGGDDEVD